MSQSAVPALVVESLSKTYRLWATPASRLWVPLLHRAAHGFRFWPWVAQWLAAAATARLHAHEALKPISFVLRRGEALGVIGHNGSGKSTLLQLIAGVLLPTTGKVTTHGRVAALLELGSGFNPELSGRENVRVNAAILGLTPAQVRERMDSILAFADIGDYVDEPVKTYSSGMAVRLAFAVQVHTDPDILIVDEALAVGDAAFQAKAMAKVDEILRRGTTLLFVGHDLNVVKAFCHRAILLEQGECVMEGLPDEVITEYLHRTHLRALQQRVGGDAALSRLPDGFGLDDVRVVAASVNGQEHVAVRFDQPLTLSVHLRLHADVRHPLLILDIMDGKGLQLSGRRIRLPRPAEGSAEVALRVGLRACLQMGVYRFRFRILDSADVTQHVVLARQEGRPSFEVVDDSREAFTGLFPLPMQVDIEAPAAVGDA